MTHDPAVLPATELVARYRTGSLSPVEAATACLKRITALNPQLNAFLLIDEDGALKAAADSEARWRRGEPLGPVDGVPVSVKDLVLTRGWPTRRGSRTIDPDQPWDEDAPAVARLRESGAVLLGKTTTSEMGWKGVTDSPLTGITRNPWHSDLTPGGSSGGAAVAAATAMAPLNIGTDGGGSIRIPASFTGVYGFKPSYGRVPVYPPSPYGTLAHLGPLTRTVADAALMLTVIARPDRRDWMALPCSPDDVLAGLDGGVAGLRIAFAPSYGDHAVDPEVAALVRAAAAVFAALGATVAEVALPFAGVYDIFMRHWMAGAATLLAGIPAERHALMDPGLVDLATAGAAMPLLDYTQAALARSRLGVAMNQFHEHWDLLLTPTVPITAFAVGQNHPPAGRYAGWQDWIPFTYPFNLTWQPAASVPCGLTRAGLPVGLQIIGTLHGDALVLRASRAFEQARPWPLPSPSPVSVC